MKKIITAAAIAAIMGSSVAIADWDMPFFSDDDDRYYDNRWNNDWDNDFFGDGRGRGRGKGRGSFNLNMDADADMDSDWEGDSYGRNYNRWDAYNYYRSQQYGYPYAPYGYGVPYGPAPVAPQAAPQAPAGTGNCPQ